MFRRYAGCVVVLGIVICAAALSWAQEAPPAAMPDKLALTIPEAIDLAWKNNIASIRQRNVLESSRAAKVGTRSTFLPSLNFDLGWARTEPATVQEVQLSNGSIQRLTLPQNRYRYGLSLRQPIFNSQGGSYLHVPQAASAQVSADEQALRSTRQELALQTKTFCYDLLKAEKLLDVQGNAVKRSLEQLETSKARYELGSASMSDFLKSKVQLGSDSLTLITRANAVEIARAELNSHLGLAVNRRTEVDVDLTFEPYPLPSDTAIQQAALLHPSVQSKTFELRKAELELGGSRFQRLPSVDATVDYSWNGTEFPTSADPFKTDEHTVGVQLSWNLFSGFATTSRISQSKVSRYAAEEELAQAKRDVLLDITKASLNVTEASKRFNVSKDQVESAQEDLKIAQEKYNLGAATILDILTAQVRLSEAETEQIQAGYDYFLSIANLERSMGGGD
jgi:outer membrane protein